MWLFLRCVKQPIGTGPGPVHSACWSRDEPLRGHLRRHCSQCPNESEGGAACPRDLTGTGQSDRALISEQGSTDRDRHHRGWRKAILGFGGLGLDESERDVRNPRLHLLLIATIHPSVQRYVLDVPSEWWLRVGHADPPHYVRSRLPGLYRHARFGDALRPTKQLYQRACHPSPWRAGPPSFRPPTHVLMASR